MPENMPLELVLEDIKNSLASHANDLCKQYSLPPAIILQILQEIVYENKLNDISQAFRAKPEAISVEEQESDSNE